MREFLDDLQHNTDAVLLAVGVIAALIVVGAISWAMVSKKHARARAAALRAEAHRRENDELDRSPSP